MSDSLPIDVGPPTEADHAAWRRLFDGYATFYGREMTDAIAATVWGWIQSADPRFGGLVARLDPGDGAGRRAVGLLHYRDMESPLRGAMAGFVDDIFVDPAARGRRVGEALIAGCAAIGRERGWPVIRWITMDDNYRARGLYDRVARRSMWVTYELVP